MVCSEKEKSFRIFSHLVRSKKCENLRFFDETSLQSISRKNSKLSRNKKKKCINVWKNTAFRVNFLEKNVPEILLRFGIYRSIYFRENFAKYERKFSQIFAKRFVRCKPYQQIVIFCFHLFARSNTGFLWALLT